MPYMTVEKDPLDTFCRFVEGCSDEQELSVLDNMLNDMLEINNHQKQMESLDENLYSNERAQYAIYVMNFDMDRVRFASEKVSSKIAYMNEMKLRELELKHASEPNSEDENLEEDPLTDEERKEEQEYEQDLPASSASLSEMAQQICKMPEFSWQEGMQAISADKKIRVLESNINNLPSDAYVSLSDPATKGILLDLARKLLKRDTLFISPPGAFSVGWGYGFVNTSLSSPKNSFKSSEEEVLATLILNHKNYLY